MSEHVFQDGMFYDGICLKGGHTFVGGNVLWVVMMTP